MGVWGGQDLYYTRTLGPPPGHACGPPFTLGAALDLHMRLQDSFFDVQKNTKFAIRFLMVFWPPKCSQKPSNIDPKSIKKTSDFLIDLLNHFGSILGAFVHYFLLPKICQNRKRRFYENELLVYTRCSFSRISAPKIYPKIDEQTIEKWTTFLDRFWKVWGRILWPLWDQNRI